MALDNLHSVLDNPTTAVLVGGRDLTLSYLNTAAETLLEVAGSRMVGGPINALFVEEDDTNASLREAQRSGSAFTKREVQLTLVPSGQQLTVDYAVTPVPDGNE